MPIPLIIEGPNRSKIADRLQDLARLPAVFERFFNAELRAARTSAAREIRRRFPYVTGQSRRLVSLRYRRHMAGGQPVHTIRVVYRGELSEYLFRLRRHHRQIAARRVLEIVQRAAHRAVRRARERAFRELQIG